MRGAKLNNRYLFSGELVLTSALHIGGGESADSPTDSAVVKLGNKQPFIPGSSLKGVFRSTVERIAANLPGVISCTLYDPGVQCLSGSEQLLEEFKRLKEEKASEDKMEGFLKTHLCETCRLFGSPYMASKVGFSDSLLQEPWAEGFEIRDGVGINRDSERAVTTAKFDFEIVPVGTRFQVLISGENLSSRELGLISIGVTELMNGMVHIGGFTSRGLGRCFLRLEKVEHLDFTDIDSVRNYLLTREMTRIEDLDGFLETHLKSLL